MARDNRVQMPTSGAGLTNFSDGFSTRFLLKPAHVVLLIILVIILVLFLHAQG